MRLRRSPSVFGAAAASRAVISALNASSSSWGAALLCRTARVTSSMNGATADHTHLFSAALATSSATATSGFSSSISRIWTHSERPCRGWAAEGLVYICGRPHSSHHSMSPCRPAADHACGWSCDAACASSGSTVRRKCTSSVCPIPGCGPRTQKPVFVRAPFAPDASC